MDRLGHGGGAAETERAVRRSVGAGTPLDGRLRAAPEAASGRTRPRGGSGGTRPAIRRISWSTSSTDAAPKGR
jgi:hypothetical protein